MRNLSHSHLWPKTHIRSANPSKCLSYGGEMPKSASTARHVLLERKKARKGGKRGSAAPTGKDMKTNPQRNQSDPNDTFAERVRLNQERLRAALKPQYDFIVCGSGSSGSVVARRLAENRDVSVLLLEAGGDDDVPSVMDADKWPMNLGSEREWNFHAEPAPGVNGRVLPLAMGKVLGGGSSINVMIWARGRKSDWDFF